MSKISNTVRRLKELKAIKTAGREVSYTTDITWLVNQAINRRAGWPDDPSFSRGSCMPVNGKYPPKACGDTYNHLRLLSREINTPNLIVRPQRLGEWRKFLMKRIPNRFTYEA